MSGKLSDSGHVLQRRTGTTKTPSFVIFQQYEHFKYKNTYLHDHLLHTFEALLIGQSRRQTHEGRKRQILPHRELLKEGNGQLQHVASVSCVGLC